MNAHKKMSLQFSFSLKMNAFIIINWQLVLIQPRDAKTITPTLVSNIQYTYMYIEQMDNEQWTIVEHVVYLYALWGIEHWLPNGNYFSEIKPAIVLRFYALLTNIFFGENKKRAKWMWQNEERQKKKNGICH